MRNLWSPLRLLAAIPLAILVAASASAAACQQHPMIFFDVGSATPQGEGMAQLQSFVAQAMPQLDEVEAIRVVGHSDRTGSASARVQVADQRAQAVRNLLMAYGVPERLIKAVGAADRYPLFETADGVREPRNRRVELTVFFKPVSAAALDLAPTREGGSPIC